MISPKAYLSGICLSLGITGALSQAACSSGVVGDLARYAQYDAIQIDCSRTYPQYSGTPVTTTKSVTSGTTTSTTTKTVQGATFTTYAPTRTVTVRVVTITTSATTTTVYSTTSTVIGSTVTETASPSTSTAPPSTVTATTTTETTTTTTTTVDPPSTTAKRSIGRYWRFRRSKEEEFQSTLKAQGASSSAVFRTFCSCYETKTVTKTTTVQSVKTTTTTTTTIPTSTITPSTTTTGTTTTTPTVRVTTASTTTIATTTTTTPVVTTTPVTTVTSTQTVTRTSTATCTYASTARPLKCFKTFSALGDQVDGTSYQDIQNSDLTSCITACYQDTRCQYYQFINDLLGCSLFTTGVLEETSSALVSGERGGCPAAWQDYDVTCDNS